MTFTPFERELLKKIDRTNELLELLVMAHQPMKIMTGPSQEEAEAIGRAVDEMVLHGTGGEEDIRDRLAGIGLIPRRSAAPPTEEQRAERFAARAKEVGLSDEEAAVVSGRIATNLDQLVQPPPPAPHPWEQEHSAESPYCGALVMRNGGGDTCGLSREDLVHEEPAPPVTTPRKRATKQAQ